MYERVVGQAQQAGKTNCLLSKYVSFKEALLLAK